MSNDEVGKDFRVEREPGTSGRTSATRDAVKILVVDPILGSRFSLVRAASQPGFVVDACATHEAAFGHLARADYALVIADEFLGAVTGLAFLEEVLRRHPRTARVLVTGENRFDRKRDAIERAGLIFVLAKPFRVDGLRRTLLDLFGRPSDFAGWNGAAVLRTAARSEEGQARDESRRYEVLVRGVLAGLNSCATEAEIFELLRVELAGAFGATRWLWIDEERRLATRLTGDAALAEAVELDALAEIDLACRAEANRSLRVARLEAAEPMDRTLHGSEACLGFGLRVGGERVWTGLVRVQRAEAAACLRVLRELTRGLQLAVQRVRVARARSMAAHDLARRVSQDLRTPVGALAHAVDLLRGEAERAGLPVEWVDRISSESERVVRVVEHLEGEMLTSPLRVDVQAG